MMTVKKSGLGKLLLLVICMCMIFTAIVPLSAFAKADIRGRLTYNGESLFAARDADEPESSAVDVGDLTIGKQVVSLTGAPDSDEFTFGVTLTGADGTALTDEFDYVSDNGADSGKITSGGTIMLQNGQSVTITGIPTGTSYTVTEMNIPAGYSVIMPEGGTESGVITADAELSAQFVNNYSGGDITPPGPRMILMFDKNAGEDLVENMPDTIPDANDVQLIPDNLPEREGYIFRGWSTNPDAQPNDADVIQAGGIYRFTDGNNIITLYAVWERNGDAPATEAPTEAPTDEPTEAPTEAPTEVPTEAPPTERPLDALTISKRVVSLTGVPEGDNFTFKVTLTDENNVELDGEFDYIGSNGADSGKIASGGTITLQDVQYVIITGIPAGTTYTVTEINIPENYSVITPEGGTASGTISMDTDDIVRFMNSYIGGEVTPPDARRELRFNKNAESSVIVENMPDNNLDAPIEAQIPDNVPEREGYIFMGWSENPEANWYDQDVMQPGGTYQFEVGNELVTLYAIWVEADNPPTPTPYSRPARGSGGGGGGKPTTNGTENGNISGNGDTENGDNANDDNPNGDKPNSDKPNDSTDGNGDNSDSDIPSLNRDDHYAYINGYPDGSIRPNDYISRVQAAAIFYRLMSDESRDRYISRITDYSDVSVDAWYNDAVATLDNAGIINGSGDGKFNPDSSVTRAEFAAIAARFDTGVYEGADKFSDIGGHWANEYINRAAELGWISGYTDGSFRPDEFITRAEAISIVNNILDRCPADVGSLSNDMNVWSDNSDTDAWYYLAIQEATNSHYWERSGNYEVWTGIRETRNLN